MKKYFILGLSLLLASCQNEPILLKATNYNFGAPPETANLKLDGISLRARDGWGMTKEQAEAFFRTHQGKTVNYFGIVHDIIVKGNQATLEIVPERTGLMQKNCTVQELLRRYGGHNCKQEQTRSFTAVQCIITDWAALNQKTKGLLLGNFKTRNTDFRKWDAVHVQGTLSNLKPKRRKVGFYDGGVDFKFGTGQGFYTKTWQYETFVVKNCQVRGFDHKVL